MNTKHIKSAGINTFYLEETPILNYKDVAIQNLVKERKWLELDTVQLVKSIYDFVRDEIKFGYNISDNIPATKVLQDGYGQCNTKATLLMALLRACHIPNRIHGFTIDKALQKGAVTGIWYRLAPQSILHSWVEVQIMDEWYYLEGVILDKPYLIALQHKFKDCGASFCGYGAYTKDFLNPKIEFELNHTFIQERGINQDFGVFNNPDSFYSQHQQNMPFLKKFIYEYFVRFLMNRNVQRVRANER